jgi:hypothetical protein
MNQPMENRVNPRYRVYLHVIINGIELTATNIGEEMTASNISAYGMQVSCPTFLMGRMKKLIDDDKFNVQIRLPNVSELCNVNAQAVYDSEVGEEHLIGLQLIDLIDSEKCKIDEYLQQLEDRNAPTVN